jgi:hypothetical protein
MFLANLKNNKYLFLITILYFALGFINIHLALLGFICMILPLALLFRNKRKTWCQGYCPRASLFSSCGKRIGLSRKTPDFFVKGSMKWIMLAYFCYSLFSIILSTVKVALNKMQASETVRFLSFIPVKRHLPQLFEAKNVLPWITQLSYGFYSMMFTTTILGLILALVYKPRTWCTICPISTVSGLYLNKTKNKG